MAQYQQKKNSSPSSSSGNVPFSPCPCRSDGTDNLGPGQTYGTWDRETLLPKSQGSQYWKPVAIALIVTFAFGFLSNTLIGSLRHESVRRRWSEEMGRWKSELALINEERQKWNKEREDHANKEAEKQRQEREKEANQRDRMAWSGLNPGQQCLRYGTREYTATLTDVPLGFDAIAECKNKSIVIHNKRWFPDRCEDQGICGRVTGHWIVNSNEALCTTWWDNFSDKGCKNGFRVYDAHLQNLQRGDDWKVMCNTTPTTINGIYFAEPVSCVDWGRNGIGGIWHLPDYKCR